jgi:hypothetical protein
MGLTIHYTLTLKDDVTSAPIHEMARRTADYAHKIGCAEVGELLRADESTDDARLLFRIGKRKDRCFSSVPPWRGWLVAVLPGNGCETAVFGLCQYPARAEHDGRLVLTGFTGGWRFHSFCKTQYAGEHGLDNFIKCHLMVVSLLDFWRSMGVSVRVNDEGGYWKTRSLEVLRSELHDYDRLVAAMGGMFKDVEGGLAVKSPIFDYRNFERLEHEGQREFGGRIRQFQSTLQKAREGIVNGRPK